MRQSARSTVQKKSQPRSPGAPFIAIPDFSSVVPSIKSAAMTAGQYCAKCSSSKCTLIKCFLSCYVEGAANLSGVSFSGTGCIYANGKITITGSGTSYDSTSSICIYSGYKSNIKSDAAIDFSGSDKHFKGILYVRMGQF